MRISDWSSDVCSSDLPSATAPGPVHTAISPPALMAKFRSEVDSLPLSWSTRGRRDTFASSHCCTLIHKRAQYLAFLSSALLARSEDRRVGKESVRTGRSWRPSYN